MGGKENFAVLLTRMSEGILAYGFIFATHG
jgi:hypothetical protein